MVAIMGHDSHTVSGAMNLMTGQAVALGQLNPEMFHALYYLSDQTEPVYQAHAQLAEQQLERVMTASQASPGETVQPSQIASVQPSNDRGPIGI